MPKQKTHKGTKKRFRMTANGKVKHRRSGTSHLQVRLSASGSETYAARECSPSQIPQISWKRSALTVIEHSDYQRHRRLQCVPCGV